MPWSQNFDGLKQRILARCSEPRILEQLAGVYDLGAGAGLWRDAAEGLPVAALPWTAVEIWRPYVAEYRLKERYTEVRATDFRRIKYSRLSRQLFIFGDVLEHLERAHALDVLRRAARSGPTVVVMPFHPTTSEVQGPRGKNVHEAHRYVWHWEEWLMATASAAPMRELIPPPGDGRNKGAVLYLHRPGADA